MSLFVVFALGSDAFSAGFPAGWGTGGFGLTNPPAALTNVAAIAAGAYHNLAVLDNGTVTGWGDGTLGKTTPPAGLSGVVAVAGGANHSLALRNNGRVVAWGDPAATNVPPGLTDAMAIAAGQFHSLAVRSNGTVVAWGANNQGQSTIPAGLSGVIAVAAGGEHSVALRANGTVVAWGQNNSGQATVPLALSGVVAIGAGDSYSMALRNNGTIVVWGNIAAPPPHAGVIAIAAGGSHCVALRNDRTVFCWGDNSLNQCVVPAGTINAIAVAAGATHSVALRMTPPRFTGQPTSRAVLLGQSTTFTANFEGSRPLRMQWRRNGVDIANATNASYTIISAQTNDGGNYTLFLSNAVGTALSAEAGLTINVPAFVLDPPDSQSVPVGQTATLAVVAGGTLPISYRWQKGGANLSRGTNSTYAIPGVTTNDAGDYRVVVSNAFGAATSIVATLTVLPIPIITAQPQSQNVIEGGTATFSVSADNAAGYQWRKNNADIPGADQPMYTIAGVQTSDAAGYQVVITNQHGAATSLVATLTVDVLPSGESLVAQWGEDPVFNDFDQVDIAVPDGLIDVRAIAAGGFHNLALRSNGRVIGWGDNLFGQAGVPPTLTNAMKISAGLRHSVALTSNGVVVAWGQSSSNQTAIPPGLSSIRAIAAGGNHTLALRSNGTVAAWGFNNSGQTIVPSNTTNVMAIAAGFEFSMALLSNGTLRTWGNNEFGQRVPPFPLSNVVAIAAGKYHSLALRSDGRVFAFGQNTFGQTNVPPEATNIIAIAAGANHSLALRGDGRLIGWGQNNFLQLQPPEGLAGIAAIAASGNRSLALKSKRLRMAATQLLGDGSVRLRIANQDGTPLDPARAGRVDVYSSPDLTLPRGQWTKRNIALSFVNGGLQGDDPAPIAGPRFYIVAER